MRICNTANRINRCSFDTNLKPEVIKEIESSKRSERYQKERKAKVQEGSLDAVGYEPKYLSCERYAGQRPVEDEVMKSWMRGYLRQLLARLPPGEKDAMEALFFDGLSVRETAGRLGCRPETVRKRRKRALLRLGICLKKAGITDSKL